MLDILVRLASKATVTLLGAAACSLACVSTSHAAWSAAARVASSRVWNYSPPGLAIDGAGAAALVWHREVKPNETLNGVEASNRAGAGWAAPVVLAPSRRSQAAYFPQVAMDARGQATAAWGTVSGVQAATSGSTGAGFGHAKTLPGRVHAAAPQVAVDARGDATVVYPQLTTGLWVVVRRVGGSWRALPAIAGTTRSGISEPQVARDSRGETILAWARGYRSGGGGLRVQAVVLGTNNKPEHPPQTLFSSRSRNIGELHLAVNDRGDAVLVWRQNAKGSPVTIEAATRRAGARFGRPVTVSREKAADQLSVALDAHGFGAILFTRIISTQPGVPEESSNSYPAYTQTAAVEVTTHALGQHWSTPSELAPHAGGSTFEPQVACDPAGRELMAVWTNARFRSTEVTTYTGKIEASAVNAGGSWQPPVVISPAASFAPTLAVSANGTTTAAWVSESSNMQSIEAADYKPS